MSEIDTASAASGERTGHSRTGGQWLFDSPMSNMFIATFFFSLGPVLIVACGASDSPFLFNGTLRLGLFVGLAFIIYKHFREYLSEKELRSSFLSGEMLFKKGNLFLVIAALGAFDLVAFSKSTEHINIAITAVIGEVQPLFHFALFALFAIFGYEGVKYRVNAGKIFCMMFALMGAILVVISQPDIFAYLRDSTVGAEARSLATGVLWAFGYAVMTSLGAPFTIRWAGHVAETIPTSTASSLDERDRMLFFALLGTLVMNAIAFPLNLIIGFYNGETVAFDGRWQDAGTFFAIAFAGGFLFFAPGGVRQRKSFAGMRNLGVIALQYFRPLFTLVLLISLGILTDWLDVDWLTITWLDLNLRWDYFGIGLAAIVVANILLNSITEEDEIRTGFKVLMVALWGCGAFVYLRDGIAESLGIFDLLWVGDGYFEILALSATVFTLILSFRLARLVSRTANEEHLTFSIVETLESLARRRVVDGRTLDELLEIESSRDPERLSNSYGKLRQYFADAVNSRNMDADASQHLGQLRVDINSLAHSKQRDNNLAEVFALVIFASSTVVLTLLSHPDVVGWPRFLVDLLSMQFAAVVIFLATNIIDFHRERNEPTVKRYSDPPGYGVRFHSTKNRRDEKVFAVVLSFFVTLTFLACFFAKWVTPG